MMDASKYSVIETLRDGGRVEIRALRASDREELLCAVARMSDESIYRRFFAPERHFSEREIESYLNIDFVSHVALVAVSGAGCGVIVAGGRYITVEPGIAEVAFSVDDAYQRQGIGGLLMKHLTAIACQSGVRELLAEVLPMNAAMLRVFKKAGLEMTTHRAGGVLHIALRLR